MQLNEHIDKLNARIVAMRAEVAGGKFDLRAFLTLMEEMIESAIFIMQGMREENEKLQDRLGQAEARHVTDGREVELLRRRECTCGMRQ